MAPARTLPERLRALGLGIVVALLLATPAHATTLVLTDGTIGPQPYQAWVDAALVPTPPGEVTLSLGGCPGEPTIPSCSPQNQGVIALSRGWANKHVVLHELGHVFDDLMPDWARLRFRAINLRARAAWTTSSPSSPNEQFAEAYALCARRLSLDERYFAAYRYAPTPARHRRTCALINAAGRAFGE